MKKYLSAVTAMLLLCLVPVCGADDGRRWAVVNTSLCYLRAEPDYESALESQCLMGTVVEITGSERYWRKVDVPDYKDVWTNELVLAEMDEAQLERYTEAPKWICVAQHSVLYSLPDESSVRSLSHYSGSLWTGSSHHSAWSKQYYQRYYRWRDWLGRH